MPISLAPEDWGHEKTSIPALLKGFPASISGVKNIVDNVAAFAALSTVDPEPEESIIVMQHEVAYVKLPCKRQWLISTEATTCCVVFLVSQTEARLAHLDGPSSSKQFFNDLSHAEPQSWDMYIVGAFGSRQQSARMAAAVINDAHSQASQIRLQLACLGPLNTTAAEPPMPRFTGAALDLYSLKLHPAVLSRDPPLLLPRLAQLNGDDPSNRGPAPLCHCFDQASDSYTPVRPPVAWAIDRLFLFTMLSMPEEQLLRMTSTSPEAEDARFPSRMRAVARYILDDMGEREAGKPEVKAKSER